MIQIHQNTSLGIYEVLSEKFRPQHYKTTMSLQDCQLVREEKESANEWKGCLIVKANDCKYKDRDSKLKKIINRSNDVDIIKELTRIIKLVKLQVIMC